MPNKKKVIVIGAGVAGLAAGIRLLAKGYEVQLLEKEDRPGGRMHRIAGHGFTFDLGPTIVMMPEIYREVFTAAGRNPDDYLPFQKLSPMFNLHYPDGDSLAMSNDLSELAAVLERFGPDEAQGYLAYLADTYKRYQVAKEEFIERSFRHAGDFWNAKSLIAAMKLKTFNSAYESLSKFIKHDKLQKSLAFQTLYIGISPYSGPSIYNIIPMIELLYGVWYLKGGMNSVAEALLRLFRELGGELSCQSPVQEIVIEEGRARGVLLGDQFLASDYLLCSADFPYAVTELIKDARYQGQYTPAKVAGMDYSCGAFLLYLGLNRRCDQLTVHNIWFAKDFQQNIAEIFGQSLPTDPSFYLYCPSRIDDSVAPAGKDGLYVLVPVPELSASQIDWQDPQVVQAYRDQIVQLVAQAIGMPDLSEQIIFEQVFTPLDFQNKFNAYRGAAFGLRPTLMQSNYFRPHNKYDHCEGLYFAGASAHPGAGVPIVLTSAKLAVQELLQDDGRAE